MEPLNNIDVIILIGVALSMLVAFIRGFVKEVLSILGLALFVVLTVYLSPLLTPWMNQFIASKLMAQFVVFLLIMAVFLCHLDYRHGQADCQDTYQYVKFYGQAVRIGFWLFASGTHSGILLSDCQNRPAGRIKRRFSEKIPVFYDGRALF